jgi:hypothetical protein
LKSPLVTWVSTETARQTTLYLPGFSGGNETVSNALFPDSTAWSPFVDFPSRFLEDLEFAKRRFQLFSEPDFYSSRRTVHLAPNRWFRVVEKRVGPTSSSRYQ